MTTTTTTTATTAAARRWRCALSRRIAVGRPRHRVLSPTRTRTRTRARARTRTHTHIALRLTGGEPRDCDRRYAAAVAIDFFPFFDRDDAACARARTNIEDCTRTAPAIVFAYARARAHANEWMLSRLQGEI